MKIIIAGAGQTGMALAKYLRSENNEIILIDKDIEKLGSLGEQLDIQTIEGSASFPAVLEKAGAAHADALLAVTGTDEINIVACGVAQSVFNIQKRIARISSAGYLSQKYKVFLNSLSIDVAVSPELETARRIFDNLPISGAVDVARLGDGVAEFVGIRCKKTAPIAGKNIAEIKKMASGIAVQFVAVRRRLKTLDLDTVIIRPGDDLYFMVDVRQLIQLLDTFGYESISPQYIVIFGGGKTALELAQLLEADSVSHDVTLVEPDESKARYLAERLDKTLVVTGDALDDSFVEDLNLKNYQLSIAATDSDENNILLSLIAKRNGILRTCALIDNPLYNTVLSGLGVDTTINPDAIVVSSILQHLRRGRVRNDYVLQSGIGEILEMEVVKTAKITKAPLGRLNIPKGIVIAGIVRNGIFLKPSPSVRVKEKDLVLVYVEHERIREAEKLFSVGFSFF